MRNQEFEVERGHLRPPGPCLVSMLNCDAPATQSGRRPPTPRTSIDSIGLSPGRPFPTEHLIMRGSYINILSCAMPYRAAEKRKLVAANLKNICRGRRQASAPTNRIETILIPASFTFNILIQKSHTRRFSCEVTPKS